MAVDFQHQRIGTVPINDERRINGRQIRDIVAHIHNSTPDRMNMSNCRALSPVCHSIHHVIHALHCQRKKYMDTQKQDGHFDLYQLTTGELAMRRGAGQDSLRRG